MEENPNVPNLPPKYVTMCHYLTFFLNNLIGLYITTIKTQPFRSNAMVILGASKKPARLSQVNQCSERLPNVILRRDDILQLED